MDVHGPYNAGPEYVDSLLDAVEQEPAKRKLTDEEMAALGHLLELPTELTDKARHERLASYDAYWAARYDAGVREVDHHVATIRARLEEMGIWENAYVIVTSDHGEALCEHGHWSHGRSTHHPELHVPLILRWPKVLPPGRRVGEWVRLIDVMPTLEAQLRLPPTPGLQGTPLVPYIAGDPPADPPPVFAEATSEGPEQKALYAGDHKLILMTDPPRRQLYDISKDPLEQHDIAAAHPRVVEALSRTIDEHLAVNTRLAADVEAEHIPVSDEQLKRLKALGYTR
jgi:arylsulfatase A-like enzyme